MPGNTIPGGAGVPPVNGTPYDPTTNPIPPMGQQPKKKKRWWIPVLIVVLVAALGVGAYVLLTGNLE